jgi:putative tryptophan/tyrosine transport system substrate-binding protein
MRRREFVTLLGGVALLVCPVMARAQQSATPVIGFLSSLSEASGAPRLAGFREGLAESGAVEGQNVAIEFFWSDGDYDRLRAMAAELVDRPVTVILAASLPAALAAKAATKSIPIVFTMGADPVALGVVPSLNRPGANITGVMQLFGALGAKRVELLRELVPTASVIAVLSNPKNPNAESHLTEVRTAARATGQRLEIFRASSEAEIEVAFEQLASKAGVLLVTDDPVFTAQRERLVALAARHAVPASYYAREFVATGGLMSYGASSNEVYRQAGIYVGRILKGAKPAELPVVQPTKFDLAINLKTAKTLGLAVAPSLLARADEVIE